MFGMKTKDSRNGKARSKSDQASNGVVCCLHSRKLLLFVIVAAAVVFVLAFRSYGILGITPLLLLLCPLMHLFMMRGGHGH